MGTYNSGLSRNFTECDSIILGNLAFANTFPIIFVYGRKVWIEHEAATSKIALEKIFFLRSLGFRKEMANTTLLRGFSKDVYSKLPKELYKEVSSTIEYTN